MRTFKDKGPDRDYSEPFRQLQIQMKKFVELMEEKNWEEASKLAISMHDLTHSLLSISNQLYLNEKDKLINKEIDHDTE